MGRILTVPVSNSTGVDRERVREAVAILADPEHAIAFRGLPSGREATAPGNDPDAMADAALSLVSNPNLYYLLNPVAVGHTGNTNGTHILSRRWLLIDVDPVKPAEHDKGMATDAEKAAAVEVAAEIAEDLQFRGWPEPIEIDSGNGTHLLYRIDLPNDAKSRDLVTAVLVAIKGRHDGPKGTLDRKVRDAPRISALPGTMKRKGEDTAERPHRPVVLLSKPYAIEVVTSGQLEDLVAAAGKATAVPPPPPVTDYSPPMGITAYASAALKSELGRIASSSPGGRNDALNDAAFRLFTMAANPSYGLSLELVETECSSYGLSIGLTEAEVRATVASARRAGEASPRPDLPATNGKAVIIRTAKGANADATDAEKAAAEASWVLQGDGATIAEGSDMDMPAVGRPAGGPKVFNVESLGRLLVKDFPEPRYAVHGLLSEGLNLLAGPPKLGKSMLALNLALTVAGGGKALGDRAVSAGDVLYLSLEDQSRRVKSRAVKMLAGLVGVNRDEASRRLFIVTAWARQDRGGLAMLDEWVRRRDTPSMFIIDVWNRYAPDVRSNSNAYSQDADAMAHVKALADYHGVTGLIVHHTRKSPAGGSKPEDFVAEVSGTLGLAGTADGILVMARDRGGNEAHLFHTGRDAEEGELVVEFDPVNLVWKSLGTAQQHVTGKVQLAAVAYLRLRGHFGATAPEIADATKQDPASVRQALNRMLAERTVAKRGNIWRWPAEESGEVEG